MSIGPVVVGVRVVYHLVASPPDRKRVTPVGIVGSPLSSSSMLNQTCFGGFASARMGALPCQPYSWTPGSWCVTSSLACGDTVAHLEDQTLGD